MLIKPKLEADLKKAIKQSSQPAAKEALKAMFVKNADDPSNSLDQCNSEVNKKINEFANKFSDELSAKLSKSLADIIDAYIKSASINIMNVPVPGTINLTSPIGPVTGLVNIMDKFIKIS